MEKKKSRPTDRPFSGQLGRQETILFFYIGINSEANEIFLCLGLPESRKVPGDYTCQLVSNQCIHMFYTASPYPVKIQNRLLLTHLIPKLSRVLSKGSSCRFRSQATIALLQTLSLLLRPYNSTPLLSTLYL